MTFMALNGLSYFTCDVQKIAKGVGDQNSVGDNATIQVVVTVGVEKCGGRDKSI